MPDNLKFNICKLESSNLGNSNVPDLESRISKHILPALAYACIYLDNHLDHLAFDQDVSKLRSFSETMFLFWLEALSLKSRVDLSSPALSSPLIWLQQEVGTPHNSIRHTTCDDVCIKVAIAFANGSERFVGDRS
jgi:hypothetical protein